MVCKYLLAVMSSEMQRFKLDLRCCEKVDNPKLPHIGWNNIQIKKSALLKDLDKDYNFYFVNSYHFIPENEEDIISQTNYQQIFFDNPKENIFGVQFHPEKSKSWTVVD